MTIEAVIPYATLGFGSLVTWILSRRKNKAEIRKLSAEAVQIEIGNAKAVINFWKETAEDLTRKLDMISSKCDLLSKKCDKLTEELEITREENVALKQKLERVAIQIDQTK